MFLVTLFSAQVVVVSLGWCELADEDLTPENSSKAVNRCGGIEMVMLVMVVMVMVMMVMVMMMIMVMLRMKIFMKNSSKAVNRCQKMRKARRCFPNQPLSKETDFIYRFCDRLP